MDSFYIFGLQRSGTTFLERLLTSNFICSVANGHDSWKHSLRIPDTQNETMKFVIFKNPYTWAESVCLRDPADLPITSPELTEHEPGDEFFPGTPMNLNRLCNLYADYALGCKRSTIDFHIVNYENLLHPKTRSQILDCVPFDRRSSGDWLIPAPGSLFMSEGYESERDEYYLKQQPLCLTPEQIDVINKTITDEVFDFLGYSRCYG